MMFVLADNEKIGQYLASRIDEGFRSRRQFCKKYLEARGEQTDSENIRKMSNRLSQILKGAKQIQLYDLLVFCQLLGVSCEDILTAGESHLPASARLTNYTAAFSKVEQEWETFVTREDSPILNADEFGKTFIDYALEAENYGLLKYLMDEQYIWFVGTEEKDIFMGFGAGTSIEKASFPYPKNLNVLDVQLKTRDELRTHMIALAIRHGDTEMLERLHAREIPTLYQMSFYSPPPNSCGQYYNAKLMEALSHANNKILEYFSGEFEITDRVGFPNRFIFPFMGELIEGLLKNENEFEKYLLKDAIRHNQYVYDQLSDLMADTVQDYRDLGCDITNEAQKEGLTRGILEYLQFYDDGRLINYFARLPETKKGLRSNIIRVDATSEDPVINRQISELNDLYDAIHHIKPNFERSADQ